MRLDHLFPIPIVRITVDPSMVENTRSLVNQYIDSKKLISPDTAHTELLTTFYDSKDFLGKLNDRSLLNFINSNRNLLKFQLNTFLLYCDQAR
jgi:hypothetical protein